MSAGLNDISSFQMAGGQLDKTRADETQFMGNNGRALNAFEFTQAPIMGGADVVSEPVQAFEELPPEKIPAINIRQGSTTGSFFQPPGSTPAQGGGIKLSKDKIKFIRSGNNQGGAPGIELKKSVLAQNATLGNTQSIQSTPKKANLHGEDNQMRQSNGNFQYTLKELGDQEKGSMGLTLRTSAAGLTGNSQPSNQLLGHQSAKAGTNRGAALLFGSTQSKFDSNQGVANVGA